MDVEADEGDGGAEGPGTRVRKDRGHAGQRGKHTFVLSDEAYERLSVHAIRDKVDRPEPLESLIHVQLPRYVVQDRGGRSPLERPNDPGAGKKDPVETLAVDETLNPAPGPNTLTLPGAEKGGARRPARGR